MCHLSTAAKTSAADGAEIGHAAVRDVLDQLRQRRATPQEYATASASRPVISQSNGPSKR
jgi:hypothetical protein